MCLFNEIFMSGNWGVTMSLTVGEILRPVACEPPMPTFQHAIHVPPPVATRPQATLTYSAPVIHTVPQNEEPIFHSGNIEVCNKVDDLQEKYEKMNREMLAFLGKEVSKKDVYDLCLVPNV